MEMHQKSCHVRVQRLLSSMREKYWVLRGRRDIRSVLQRCVTCKRFDVKPFAIASSPLPADRVRDEVPFEITGVDFAGPLYLKNGIDLGQLKSLNETKLKATIKIGDIVLIGNDFRKRIEWPIRRVVDVMPRKDGCVRLVRVRTSRGELLRPIQRLECSTH
ncbi:hypothetical protein NQ317_007515 [Molorchus minor]|uniref:DUF5641 domain-containing protein n=1 Tax=Molorchus minor TaxID=1323400 RepID=A0ABQ9J0R8_9CUCU|nr:hypothetical protein NQ317_007515 [Molorchus minor]